MRIKLLTVMTMLFISALAVAAPPKKIFVSQASATNGDKTLAGQMDVAVCAAVGQDKRFDSSCYTDIQSIMQADALNAMMGSSTACAGDDCTERLAKRVKADAILLIKVMPIAASKASKSKANAYNISLSIVRMQDAKTLAKIDQKCQCDAKGLFDQSQAATKKLLAQLK